jgi:long-chain acyl-CoA synthetase
MAERTLAHIVESFRLRGTDIAYVCRRGYRIQRWSYQQIADSARRLAGELQNRGIHSGDRVFLWGDDCAEWVISFFGSILCGAVVVPMDRTASLEFARRIYRQVDARLCLCSRGMPLIDPDLPRTEFESMNELTSRHASAPLRLPDLNSRDAVEIVFTSGTTADPKGVVLSHHNILANLDPLKGEISKYLKYERFVHPLRFLNLLPLSHVFGQFLGLFIPQLLGSTVVFRETLNPSEIIRTIKRERVSVLVTVPRMMETLKETIERDLEQEGRLLRFRRAFDFAEGRHFIRRWWRFRKIHRRFGWKFWAFISGGASLSSEVEQFWGRLGFAVIQGYGLTETTSLISVNHPFKLSKGSIGKVLPGRELKLAQDGEILIRGESVAKSYFQRQEIKPVSGEEGWFHTGDMGSLDEEGNLYFKGRSKNVIVSPEGKNIYPEDLVAALRRQPEIRDCIVLDLERNGNSEACAVLILQSPSADPALVIRRANESLEEYQRIRRWLVWPEEDFPRTSTQKPLTGVIREYLDTKFERPERDSARCGMLPDIIAGITGLNAAEISRESDLIRELNIGSIERVELLSALEDRFQVDLDEAQFAAANTVGEVEQMLHRPSSQRVRFQYPRWALSAPIAMARCLVYYLLTWPATHLLAHPDIHGREHLHSLQGPLLFASNHVTEVDVGFVLAALPLRFRHHLSVAMVGEMLEAMRNPPPGRSFFKKWADRASYWLVTALFNVFPLPQKAGFRMSFDFAGEAVDRGYSLLVFPEGSRTRDGNLRPFRTGIGLLATNLNIPIVPVRISGLYELKKAGKIRARPGAVRVSIGPALRFDPQCDPFKIARELEVCIESLSES